MTRWQTKFHILVFVALLLITLFPTQQNLSSQDAKIVQIKERKILATFSVGNREHELGFSIFRVGTTYVPVGPRLRFVTPNRKFLWISDLVKKRLVLMNIHGDLVKSISAKNGEIPWDLYGAMDAEGNFYFWDKVVNKITKVTTNGMIKEITLDWRHAERLLGRPIKRTPYEFRPKCWIDGQGNIYVRIVTDVIVKGDDVIDGMVAFIHFDQFGQSRKVIILDNAKDIDFVDKSGKVYVTKMLPTYVVVTIYDQSGQIAESFSLRLPKPGRPSLGRRGKYLVLTYDDGTKFFYNTTTKKLHVQSPDVINFLGIRYKSENGFWSNWVSDYNDERFIYFWFVNKETAILEIITLEF
jgi:hypothetical protein